MHRNSFFDGGVTIDGIALSRGEYRDFEIYISDNRISRSSINRDMVRRWLERRYRMSRSGR